MQLDGKELKDASVSDAKLVESYIKANGTRAFTGDQSMGSNKITNLADPIADTDAANKGFVLAVAAGARDPKDAVRAATTANITLSGPQTIDGVAVIAGDRVLVKDQTTGANNGIYIVQTGAWTRSTDADNVTISGEVTNGMLVPVSGGGQRGGFMLITADPITLGTTALVFTQVFSGANVVPTISDKELTPTATTGNSATTGLAISSTPGADGYVRIHVNGLAQVLGNAVKTKDCYFSVDGGTTARAISAITAGDTLYWNGVIAAFDLAATDRLDFDYSV